MVYCAVCHARLNFCSPDIFICPTGHYAIKVTMSQGERTHYDGLIRGGLHATLPRSWADDERTPVPSAFQEAFKDGEVLEP